MRYHFLWVIMLLPVLVAPAPPAEQGPRLAAAPDRTVDADGGRDWRAVIVTYKGDDPDPARVAINKTGLVILRVETGGHYIVCSPGTVGGDALVQSVRGLRGDSAVAFVGRGCVPASETAIRGWSKINVIYRGSLYEDARKAVETARLVVKHHDTTAQIMTCEPEGHNPDGQAMIDAVRRLDRVPAIELVESDYFVRIPPPPPPPTDQVVLGPFPDYPKGGRETNDPMLPQLWGLQAIRAPWLGRASRDRLSS